MMTQICAQVIGNDTVITVAGQSGNFELNVMMPLIASNLLESIDILGNGAQFLNEKCVTGIEANEKRAKELVEHSLAMATSLVPVIGYDKAAKLAKEAYSKGKTIREILKESRLLSNNEIDRVLDPQGMLKPKA